MSELWLDDLHADACAKLRGCAKTCLVARIQSYAARKREDGYDAGWHAALDFIVQQMGAEKSHDYVVAYNKGRTDGIKYVTEAGLSMRSLTTGKEWKP